VFLSKSKEPDYENKVGRIVAFNEVPLLKHIRDTLPSLLGDKAKKLNGEGNKYLISKSTGMGLHGDKERRKIVGVRLGCTMKLDTQSIGLYNTKVPCHFITNGFARTLKLET